MFSGLLSPFPPKGNLFGIKHSIPRTFTDNSNATFVPTTAGKIERRGVRSGKRETVGREPASSPVPPRSHSYIGNPYLHDHGQSTSLLR
ncbi:hypothetical protein J6590_001693 [Homalodisca vitripennis]|nr:hypothetical protein J6590_001693 [Homalodisca vitripennis]